MIAQRKLNGVSRGGLRYAGIKKLINIKLKWI